MRCGPVAQLYDNIYGKSVLVSSKAQVNPQPWKGNPRYNHYITAILRKEINFFITFIKLHDGPFCIVKVPTDETNIPADIGTEKDAIVKDGRVLVWTRESLTKRNIRKIPTPGTGHNKNGAIPRKETFCAKDIGIVACDQ